MSKKTPPILRWTRLAPSDAPGAGRPCARSSHGLSLVNGRLILYGGEHVARTPLDAAQACWGLDLTQDLPTWYAIGVGGESGPSPRVAHAQAVVGDARVYVFGGRQGVAMDERPLCDMWVLDCSGPPGSETWSRAPVANLAGLPKARSFHRMIADDSTLYIFGGCGSAGRMADLYSYDTKTNVFRDYGSSSLLRGRGGPNLLSIARGSKLAVVAGFAGEETADGQRFDLETAEWESALMTPDDALRGLRPRSVCVSASFPSVGVSVVFGGEVNASDRGHEGAGGFANDLVVLDEADASLLTAVTATSADELWPEPRGWSDGAAVDNGDGTGQLYVFGGLSGDDQNPVRLDDLWRLDIAKA